MGELSQHQAASMPRSRCHFLQPQIKQHQQGCPDPRVPMDSAEHTFVVTMGACSAVDATGSPHAKQQVIISAAASEAATF